MAEIRLENIVKRYDNGHVAVSNACLHVQDGEFLVLVGPSGCGKSTTLRMIAGLEEVTEGDLLIGDKRVNDLEPGDRDIAMVFQNYALYPHMTVRDNMSFGLRMRKESKAVIEERVDEAAKILSIESLLDRKPKQLSGGQRQRVAVGRAIVRKPVAFLFDEPLSNLDAKLRVQMRTELARLHQKLQTTTIYVTHDQVEAMTLGDRIVVMKDSKIQQVDTPLNLYNNPCNKFVASFIGSPAMNFLPGEFNDGSFRSSSVSYNLSTINVDIPPGKCILGFRPEDLSVDGSAPFLLKAEVDVVERMGHETIIYFAVDSAPMVARLSGDANVKSADIIDLHLPTDKWHLFEDTNDGPLIVCGDQPI